MHMDLDGSGQMRYFQPMTLTMFNQGHEPGKMLQKIGPRVQVGQFWIHLRVDLGGVVPKGDFTNDLGHDLSRS